MNPPPATRSQRKQDGREGMVYIWTDGSASVKHKNGGLAFVSTFNDRRIERWCGFRNATVNQMELGAVYAALLTLRPTKHPVLIRSDSTYSINALTKWFRGWRRSGWLTAAGQPVKNRELIEVILAQIEEYRKHAPINFKHVKGHSGAHENERADFLCGQARCNQLSSFKDRLILASPSQSSDRLEGDLFTGLEAPLPPKPKRAPKRTLDLD